MDFIKDLKDLEKLLKLARKHGLSEFTCGSFTCKIGPLPKKQAEIESDDEMDQQEAYEESVIDQLVGMPVSPTDEQLMDIYHPIQTNEQEPN